LNCYTAEFIEHYHPVTETFIGDSPEIRETIKARKKELKKEGYMVRTHWYTSLGSYALRAIKYKLGTPTDEVLKEMKSWIRF
jgi:hypothetical protein